MKIVILGAGQVGGTLAEHLSAIGGNDVTVVDSQAERLSSLQDKIDIRTVLGHASHPQVLAQAGVEDADLLIAVTSSDETNMLACRIAYSLYQTPTKIARVRAMEYLHYQELFNDDSIPMDVLISPEQLVTNFVRQLISHPGALQVLDFAGGKVQLVAVKAYHGGALVGHAIKALREHMPGVDSRVAAIFRQGRAILPDGDTVIEINDEVFFLAAHHDIRAVMSELRRLEKPYKRIIIAGGGNIGFRLAESLENDYSVKIIERQLDRAKRLAERLNGTIVLQGDAADRTLLLNENIEETDVFCALTNDDEANIMAAILAKRLGARKVMALINRAAYVDLIEGGEIDIAISPQQATVSSLLAHVRRGDIEQVHTLRRGAAEAIEIIAHGTAESSKVVGRQISQLPLSSGVTIGAIVRDNKVIIAHHDVVIESEDHVILFLTEQRRIGEVEALFQVGLHFF